MELGNILERMRKDYRNAWKTGGFVFLAAVVLLNLFVLPPEAEYGLDGYPGFWAIFGLGTTLLMVLIMKKVIQPIIAGPEEEEGDDD